MPRRPGPQILLRTIMPLRGVRTTQPPDGLAFRLVPAGRSNLHEWPVDTSVDAVVRMPGDGERKRSVIAGGKAVLVVDNDRECCEGLVAALTGSGYRAYGVTTAKEAVRLAREERPAVVISEVVLPEQSGYELCRTLREQFGQTLPVLLLSGTRTDALDSVVAFLIGADDYITKPFEIEEVLARVHRSIARAAASSPASTTRAARDLTAREHEILRLLSAGVSQKEIAERLVITPKTVATHIQRILGKLGVHSRTEAVAFAYRSGLLNGGTMPMQHRDGDRAEMPGPALEEELEDRLSGTVLDVAIGRSRAGSRKSERAA